MSTSPRRVPQKLVWLTAVAFAIRLVHVMVIHPIGHFIYSDMKTFYDSAVVFSNPNHVADKWDAARPWAMGLLGGPILRAFGRDGLQWWGLLQVLLSTASVPLTFVGARRFLGERVAFLAAGLLALDPLAIAFSGYLMSETYLMFCLSLAFAFLAPERPGLSFVAGIAMGLGALFKAQALPLALAWGGVFLLWQLPPHWRDLKSWLTARPRVAALTYALGAGAVLTPQAIALSMILHKPSLFAPYGGQNFFLGHCPVREVILQGGPEGGVLYSLSAKAVELNEPWPDVTFYVSVFDSAFYVKEGMKCLTRSLPHTLRWGAEQLFDSLAGVPGHTLDPWPVRMDQPATARLPNLAISYLLFPFALWALWKRRRDAGVWLAVGCPLLGAVWGLALLFSGNPRYREPFDLFIFVGAALAFTLRWPRPASPAGESVLPR